MLRVLKTPSYAKLFAAQVVALLGTGLLTIALGLLAYDLAGDKSGAVLGTALGIKMMAYVGCAPIAAALIVRLPRRAVLIGADLVRASIAIGLPFVNEVWQIYVLIFVLQAASATFTPCFQAIIPDILPDEADYTNALSLSRLTYDLENIVSPALAGLLLAFISFHWLFLGTVVGFVISALLVTATVIPDQNTTMRPFRERLTRGIRHYLSTPRLRGLLALNLTASAAGAFVIVNTVVLVRANYEKTASDVTLALGAFGFGSILAAIALPNILARYSDRFVMMLSAVFLTAITLGGNSPIFDGVR